MKTQTAQYLRKRKFLLVLPMLALPFITLAFWSLGGGTGKNEAPAEQQQGLNTELPGAQNTAGPLDKLSLYNQAARDSATLAEQLRNDPYAQQKDTAIIGLEPYHDYSTYQTPTAYRAAADPNEQKVKARLAALEKALNSPVENTIPQDSYEPGGADAGLSTDLDRLEAMMHSMNGGGQADPEMQQINMMLEKILDIQNPGRVQEKLREQSQRNRGRVYSVGRLQERVSADVFAGVTNPFQQQHFVGQGNGASNAFYDISGSDLFADTLLQLAIPAVVHETQTLISGATVKMRLTEAVFINGVMIPQGTFISGHCNVDGERLKIDISGIRYGSHLFPVALAAYDLDAIEGIRIPGAITRDAAKDGADRALQGVQFMSLDPSIGAQAAGAGVEVAKGLFGKKTKLVRVTVKAGHPLLLMDMKAKQFN